MPFLVLKFIRLLTFSHSSIEQETHSFIHTKQVENRCRHYGKSCRSSLARTRSQHSQSLQCRKNYLHQICHAAWIHPCLSCIVPSARSVHRYNSRRNVNGNGKNVCWSPP